MNLCVWKIKNSELEQNYDDYEMIVSSPFGKYNGSNLKCIFSVGNNGEIKTEHRVATVLFLLQTRNHNGFEHSRELHRYINYTHVSNQCLTRGRERGWGFTKLRRGLRCAKGYRAPHSDARIRARYIACSNIILSNSRSREYYPYFCIIVTN